MRLNIFTKVLFLATIIISAISCTKDFENINTDPTKIPNKDIPIAPRFSVPQRSVVFMNSSSDTWVYQLTQNLNADGFSGYMGTASLYNSNSNNYTYSLLPNWNAEAFNRGMTNILKTTVVIIKESEERKFNEFTAIAKIIKVAGISRVTDTYGPIPYSKAIEGGVTAPYDSQKDIYASFFKELKEATIALNEFIANDPVAKWSPSRISEFDLICGGNVSKWLRFCNTLRLRLAIRLSAIDPTTAKAEAEAAVDAPGGLLLNSDGIIGLSAPNLDSPLYILSESWANTGAGAPIVHMMQSYNDPRLERYFKPTVATEISNIDGVKVTVPSGVYGVRTGITIADQTNYGTLLSKLNVEKETTKNPLVWMKPSEAYFLRAEGALRGWNMNDNPKSLYEQGIQASLMEEGIAPADVSIYLEENALPDKYTDLFNPENNLEADSKWLNNVTVKWNDNGTPEYKLQQIITQKYISMYPNSVEAWTEYRRTGYPKQMPVMINLSNGTISTEGFIRRLPFTDNEKVTNSAEVDKAIIILGGADNGGTKLYWDVDAIITGDNKL